MSYIWFQQVLAALGKRLNFESISSLYGNSFAKDAGKIIQSANPLVKEAKKKSGGIESLFGSITIIKNKDKSKPMDEATKKAELRKKLGDISWVPGLFDTPSKTPQAK